MSTFRVKMTQWVIEEAVIYIEADDREQAEQRALIQVEEGKVRWRFLEVVPDVRGEVEIVSIRKVVR